MAANFINCCSITGVTEEVLIMMERNDTEKGYVGETYVTAKLSRAFNITSAIVPQDFFSYDLITNNNKRIEVKTAILRKFERKHPKKTYYSDAWEFGRNPKQRHEGSCDFVVCVCFSSKDFSDNPRCFIIPWKELHGRSVFKISANPKRKGEHKFWNYEDKWDAIVKDNASGSSDIKNAEKL